MGKTFFVYSEENYGIKRLYWYYTRILITTSRRVFYESIMGNKHEVLSFKAKLWGSGGQRWAVPRYFCTAVLFSTVIGTVVTF